MRTDSLGRRIAATSLEAYEAIKAEGLLSELEAEVYQLFMQNADMTVSEAKKKWELFSRHGRQARNECAKPVSALKKKGVLELTGDKRPSVISGRNEEVLRLSLTIPKKTKEKPKTKVQLAIESERARCLDLAETKLLHCHDIFARRMFQDLCSEIKGDE